MHAVVLIDLSAHALGVQASVEFLSPADDSIDIDLAGQSVVIVVLDILLDLLVLQLAFDLVAHPLQAILLQVCLHLLDFLLQLSVLLLQRLHLLILLVRILSEAFEKGVFVFELLELLRFLLHNPPHTFISSLWFLHVFSTACSLAAMEVSRSLSDWGTEGTFCLGGSLANGYYFFSLFFSVLAEEGGISAAKSLSILLEI